MKQIFTLTLVLAVLTLAVTAMAVEPALAGTFSPGDGEMLLGGGGSSDGTIEWQRCLGGSDDEYVESIQQTSDGGYILAGRTGSFDGDVNGNHGDPIFKNDIWVVKLDADGTISWQRCLGGSMYDEASSVVQTSEGGYIVAGLTFSNDSDVSGNHGVSDCWVVKLDADGAVSWQRCLGGSSYEYARSIRQTADGGYIVAGDSLSDDGDVSGNHGSFDGWVAKLGSDATIEWQRSLGGSGEDRIFSVRQTADGGYVVAGTSESNDGDVSGNHGGYDAWMVRLSADGAIEWQRSLGGSGDEHLRSVEPASDGGYVVAGTSESNDGDVSGNHGMGDFWVVKLDADGAIEWQRSPGGSGDEDARSIEQTSDGGYVVAGTSASDDGDVRGNHGMSDLWVAKLDADGAIEWQRCLGGSAGDSGRDIEQTTDGGYIVAAYTESVDGDVGGKHLGNDTSNSDFWVVKLRPEDPAPPLIAADFTADVTSGRPPLSVQFTDISTGAPSRWAWDFGDGNRSTAQHPTHTYVTPGTFTVSLSVDGGEATCTRPSYITVTRPLYGDANDNGVVNQADTLRVLKEVVGLSPKPEEGTAVFVKTDVDRNGVIEVGDAMFIAQYNVGLRDASFAPVDDDDLPPYIVGIDGDDHPYSWMTLDGEPTGFDVESVRWIAAEMGFEVEIAPMDRAEIIPALQAGTIDMVYSGMAISPEHLEVVNFSKPYWTVNQAVAACEGSAATIDDVKEGRVVMGVPRGSTAHTWIDRHLVLTGKLSTDDCKIYKNVHLALADLQNRRVDAVMYDVPVIKESIQGKPLVMIGTIRTDEEYGVAVRKDDNELRAVINEGLDRLMASPKWDELIEKYRMI